MNTTTDNAAGLHTSAEGKADHKYVYLLTAVAAVGGFLFGFDTAIIAGAIGFIKEHFQLDPTQMGLAVSSVLIGCIIGAAIAGTLSDRIGRKKVLVAAALVFVATAILAAIPRTLTEFAVARLLMGIAVGIESMLSPLYIAEIAPANIRGKLVTLNHVALVFGMLCAYTIAWSMAGLGPAVNWRVMFASGAVPAAIFLVALARVPESPRWLTQQGRSDEAVSVLARITGPEKARSEVDKLRVAVKSDKGSISQLFQPGLRTPLLIGVALALMQQITGINAIMYYAPEVFKQAGFATSDALMVSVLVGIVTLIANVIALYAIDKIGRRPLLLSGVTCMALTLGATGAAFSVENLAPVFTATLVLIYVACFSVSLGPGFWLVLSEIFPTRVRGRAMSIATVVIWASCFIVAQTFPMLVDKVGASSTFWLYGAMCIVTILLVWRFLPETKGKTLEEIEKLWTRRSIVDL